MYSKISIEGNSLIYEGDEKKPLGDRSWKIHSSEIKVIAIVNEMVFDDDIDILVFVLHTAEKKYISSYQDVDGLAQLLHFFEHELHIKFDSERFSGIYDTSYILYPETHYMEQLYTRRSFFLSLQQTFGSRHHGDGKFTFRIQDLLRNYSSVKIGKRK
ncbi:MAG: hypothetical protein ACFB10_23915 [Salibacteraceae bacterium]